MHARQASRHEIEIRTVYRILRHRPLRRLLRRLNIDLTENSWRAFDDMIFRALDRCAHCRTREACRQWLAEPHPGEAQPAFCPNGAVIEACRILDPRDGAPRKEEGGVAGEREPTVTDILADPITALLMRADGLEPHDLVRNLLEKSSDVKISTGQGKRDI